MHISFAQNEAEWESFLQSQPWSPFLQSWTMGEVYAAIGEEPIRLVVVGEGRGAGVLAPAFAKATVGKRARDEIVGICQAIVVPAKRGKHLAVMYGPVGELRIEDGALKILVAELKKVAKENGCSFIRMSPFWSRSDHPERGVCGASNESKGGMLSNLGFRSAPLHMLAEHIWYLNLTDKTEEDVLKGMRKTTRNLVRRAEREGVEVHASDDPVRDLPIFLKLHEETRRRHHFTPYPDEFFREQVEKFSNKSQVTSHKSQAGCALYIARYKGEPVAASIHMIYGGETSYHHGASTMKYPKIPVSYLLQWRAIQDALRRGDRIYNFWGVAPGRIENGKLRIENWRHPFAGVTTFKTGFGGQLLELVHCMDLPLSKGYWMTFGVETVRKWRRGF